MSTEPAPIAEFYDDEDQRPVRGADWITPTSVHAGHRLSDGKPCIIMGRSAYTLTDARWLAAHLLAAIGRVEGYPSMVEPPAEAWWQRMKRQLGVCHFPP